LDTLPWASFDNADVSAAGIIWWSCGTKDVECAEAFLSPKNTIFWEHIHPHCEKYAEHACAPKDYACSCLKYINSSHFLESPVGTTDWNMNQWGLCLFPQEAWIAQVTRWANGASSTARPFVLQSGGPHSGTCRPWGSWDHTTEEVPGRDEGVSPKGEALATCSMPAVNAFTLIMGTFGSFIKIVEPFSRMKRSTDRHQKTIILIIILASSIPSLVGLIVFRNGCVRALNRDYSDWFSQDATAGPGAILFGISIVVLVPIAVLHILLKSGATTAIEH